MCLLSRTGQASCACLLGQGQPHVLASRTASCACFLGQGQAKFWQELRCSRSRGEGCVPLLTECGLSQQIWGAPGLWQDSPLPCCSSSSRLPPPTKQPCSTLHSNAAALMHASNSTGRRAR